MADFDTDYSAVREGIAAVWLGRDVLRMEGPDAVSFLQGQLSQDVAAVAVGDSAWSFLLQPQGKVDALVRLTRTDDDEVVLDVDAGWGDAVLARLNRFKLRVKVEIEPLPWQCLAVRGITGSVVVVGGAVAVPAFGTGVDILGDDVDVPEGVPVCSAEAYEVLRIEQGWPAMGRELTDKTIPAEAGIVERTVSFTKGCYTGQELVARIDSRGGNVPRHLRGVVVHGEAAAGTPVSVDGKEVGALTSVARSPSFPGATVALAYVHRDVEPGATATVGEVTAEVRSLPLVP
ncbi:MAG TPA: glycine cleavage T C-terminal barrel domain-containing protein [Acidimicrobiales bacterium]|jgi:folate-binding protein YgfZ